uniref:Uncharacterized protein n=1 Tax=Avena sativa TaxID=4498 RepID=A0ACD6A4A8_AVESA
MEEESSKNKLSQDDPLVTAASLFTDDLILEILSRLPARSVRRFKCVSMPWRDLIADPVHRKKLPQTLAGFLYRARRHHFVSVSDSAAQVDLSLTFLQPKYKYIDYVDTCNGLLLCACSENNEECHYVVCNPATERWIELPPRPQAFSDGFEYCAFCLAFDPKVSSHFHVLEFGETFMDVGSCVTGVNIFSSQTGAWIHRDCGLVEQFTTRFDEFSSVFFGGMLHLVGKLDPVKIYNEPALLVVDMEGKAWKTIPLPSRSGNGTIGLSRGCLYYASTTRAHVSNINKRTDVRATKIVTLWCLENDDSKEWVLKHSDIIDEPLSTIGLEWRVFAIHPDCDTVFLDGDYMSMAAYDMQHQKFVRIHNLEEGNNRRYIPYVPLFTEALAVADGQ